MCGTDMSTEIREPRVSGSVASGSDAPPPSTLKRKKSIPVPSPPPFRVITNNNGMMVSRMNVPTASGWNQSAKRSSRSSVKPSSRTLLKSGTVRKLVGVWEKRVTEATEKTKCGCGRPGCKGAVGCEARMSWQVMVGRHAVKLKKQRELRERAKLEAKARLKSRDLDACLTGGSEGDSLELDRDVKQGQKTGPGVKREIVKSGKEDNKQEPGVDDSKNATVCKTDSKNVTKKGVTVERSEVSKDGDLKVDAQKVDVRKVQAVA